MFNKGENISIKIYLDDERIPIDSDWILVKSCEEFIKKIEEVGLDNIEVFSLDHDLGDSAMAEYYNNVDVNFTLKTIPTYIFWH